MANNRNSQTATVNAASGGLITVVAPKTTAGVQSMIKVWGAFINVGGTTNITFQDANGNALSGPMALTAQNQISLATSSLTPWLISGNGFVINASGSVQVSGWVIWSY